MAIDVKHLIVRAAFELSQEKPLAKVTVVEIAKRSGVGRQTFYNYFKDKNDLIRWVFLSTLDRWDLVEQEGYHAYLRDLYGKAQQNSRFLRQACMLSGQNSLVVEIYKITYKYYQRHVIHAIGEGSLDPQTDYALRYNAYGAANCYIEWLIKGMPCSPEEMATFTYESMSQSIRQYFT